ncbi:MAG: metalloregulator ArsR/SmtB family transcription factor [Candidatus Sericytochromatia bacterium]|nr:metalloregulator ArsR/SmtB family transcription factor [Candidatus Sericytochromatia bacterium]
MKEKSFVRFSQLLRVLSHPVRLRIIELLLDSEYDVGTLGHTLGLDGSAVSQHLALLRAHRLVDLRRAGQRSFYRLSSAGLGRWLLAGSCLAGGEPLLLES